MDQLKIQHSLIQLSDVELYTLHQLVDTEMERRDKEWDGASLPHRHKYQDRVNGLRQLEPINNRPFIPPKPADIPARHRPAILKASLSDDEEVDLSTL